MEPSIRRFTPNALRRMLNSINAIRFLDHSGEIEFFGQKVILLPREAVTIVLKELQKVGKSAAVTILRLAGRSVGAHHGRLVLKSLGETGAATLDPQLLGLALEESNIGFGKMRLSSLDLENLSASVQSKNGFEALDYGRTTQPVCTFTTGFLEGCFGILFGKQANSEETSCVAKGDEYCEFQISTKNSIHA